jgi:tripartite-type tricarboxylate transporter receptor subunit TctC
MSESGLTGIDVLNYFAISAPAGTPPAIVNTLNAAINKIVTMPDVLARFKVDAVGPGARHTGATRWQFIEADYRAEGERRQDAELKDRCKRFTRKV